ncbi:CDP-diacylglycerol--glycerol-3-phosphate 3-phosphatidyltransferase, partial [bacterium]
MLNLPNALTWLRIFAVPLVVVLFYMPEPWADPAAGLLFAGAAITDGFDGYLARRMN